MKIVSVAQMRAIEQEADASGLSYDQMMANAGKSLAEVILRLGISGERRNIFGLVGPGNNGGDTLIALTHIKQAGWPSRAYLIKKRKDELVKRFIDAGGETSLANEDLSFEWLAGSLGECAILVDGVLGTGISLPLKDEIAKVLEKTREIISGFNDPPLVIAVDCPSGIDCDTGEAAKEVIPADITITMAAVKQGMLKLPAFNFVGELNVVDIGLPSSLRSLKPLQTDAADQELVAKILPERPADAHKGNFGTVLIAAGSVNYTGAALLAGKAAYRSGAGLVTLAVPAPLHTTLAGQFPEATWILLPHEQGVIAREAAEVLSQNLGRATALLIGPGFGMEDTTREFIENLLSGKVSGKRSTSRIGFVHDAAEMKGELENLLPPLIFDADGLKLLAKITDWHKLLPAPAILTPHPGEMGVLTGLTKEHIQANRQDVARKYAGEWGHVVVLKGAFTVVADPEGSLTIIPEATAALARAGTGDVLAGLIAGLRAQGVKAYEAAIAGAWIHARAGTYAADRLGSTATVMAGDVLEAVPEVLADLNYKPFHNLLSP